MFIPYSAQAHRPKYRETKKERDEKIAAQIELIQNAQAHGDHVLEVVLGNLAPSMTDAEMLEVFFKTEADLGKVMSGGHLMLNGDYAPLIRQGVLRQIRAAMAA